MSKKTSLPRAVALAALLACTAGAGMAAERDVAFARAVEHIQAFPGRTMHGEGHSYRLRDVVADRDGAQHVRVDRLYRGLRVIGGDMVVHMNRTGAFLDASRTLRDTVRLDITPSQLRPAANSELVVYARGESPLLAWLTHQHGEQADGTPSELNIITDAHTGADLDRWDDVHTGAAAGVGNTLFLGDVPITTNKAARVYVLQDPTRGNSKTVDMRNGTSTERQMSDADNLWGDGTKTNRQTVAVDAAAGHAFTWDYYLNVHGRNGIADDGVGATSKVHQTLFGLPWVNASWSDSCFCMSYGDGDASYWPLVAVDVAGHEMSHGVTSRTAGLIYSGESGGLNEATSDIFGTMVEFYAKNPAETPDYLIGEKPAARRQRPAAQHDQAQHRRRLGRLLVCRRGQTSTCITRRAWPTTSTTCWPRARTCRQPRLPQTCQAGDTRVATGSAVVKGVGRRRPRRSGTARCRST
jgi:Zn-dependent metalloprotease